MGIEEKFDILLAEMKNICNKIDERFEKVDSKKERNVKWIDFGGGGFGFRLGVRRGIGFDGGFWGIETCGSAGREVGSRISPAFFSNSDWWESEFS